MSTGRNNSASVFSRTVAQTVRVPVDKRDFSEFEFESDWSLADNSL